MKKIILAVLLVLALSSCKMMTPEIADGILQMDENCKKLFKNYMNVLANKAFPDNTRHEMMLINATLILSDELKQAAEKSK